MTDYDYSKHQVHLSDTDSGQNSAQDIGGYDLNVTPQANWPGLDAKPKQVRFNHDAMIDVAKWLEDQANQLADLPNQVQTNMAQVGFGPANWPPAKALGRANDQVKGAVGKYSTELINNLKEAAASIRAAAKSNQQADDHSAASSDSQSGEL